MRKIFWIFFAFTFITESIMIYRDPFNAVSLIILLPLWAVGLYDVFQKKHTLKRNYPLVGKNCSSENIQRIFETGVKQINKKSWKFFASLNRERKPKLRTWVYIRPVTICRSR